MALLYSVVRTNDEIDDVLDTATKNEDSGKQLFPGMTYEQGVSAALRWVLGLWEDHPFNDEDEVEDEEDEGEDEE